MIKKLEKIKVTDDLIQRFFAADLIDNQGRDVALEMISPNKNWGVWASRLLLLFGSALVLAGVVYFFAFNWQKLSPTMKFTIIEGVMIISLIMVDHFSLSTLKGKILLLVASTMAGVFMAVFGQIYQTGANSYELFAMWSALIFVWVLISSFAGLWACWVIITNFAIYLWWDQASTHMWAHETVVFAYLFLFNGILLFAREVAVSKRAYWLSSGWTRTGLVVLTHIFMLVPVIYFISGSLDTEIEIIATLAVVGYIVSFWIYRYKLYDIKSLSINLLFASGILIYFISQFLDFNGALEDLLLMAVIIIIIFSSVIYYLRKTAIDNRGCNE